MDGPVGLTQGRELRRRPGHLGVSQSEMSFLSAVLSLTEHMLCLPLLPAKMRQKETRSPHTPD